MPHIDVAATHSGVPTDTSHHSLEAPSPASETLHHRSPSAAAPNRNGLILPLFMATIFLSSLLVFSVQPMFAKMVLPLLGGSPGVWNTAMLFFQSMLLLGYIYAHLTTKLLGVQRQAWLPSQCHGFDFFLFAYRCGSGLDSVDGESARLVVDWPLYRLRWSALLCRRYQCPAVAALVFAYRT